jgi:O-antigen/teichoic acid export membrane protein
MDSVRKSLVFAAVCRAISIAVLLATPPIFLAIGSSKLLGGWLVLVAVPTAFNLLDLGIPHIAGSYMAINYAKGDYKEYASIFWTSLSYTVVIAPILFVLLFFARNSISVISMEQRYAGLVATLVGLMVLVAQANSTTLNAIRASGRVTLALTMETGSRVVELACVAIALFFTHNIVGCMATAIVSRTLFLAASVSWLMLSHTSVSVRASGPSWPTFKRLVLPSSMYAMTGVANLCYFQIPIVILSATVGLAASAAYNSYRTMSRMSQQMILPLMDPMRPQLSAAYGVGDIERMRIILAHSLQIIIWSGVASGLGLGLFGGAIFRVWTLGKIPYDQVAVLILLASAFLYGVGQVCLIFLASIAKHQIYSLISAGATAAGLLGYQVFGGGGVRQMAAWLVMADLVMATAGVLLVQRLAPEVATSGLLARACRPPLWILSELTLVWRKFRPQRSAA